MSSSRLIPALAAAVGLTWVPVAHATFPGANGRIALSFDTGCVGTVQPSGAGMRGLGPCAATPASGGVDWSPDGKRLLFARLGAIWLMRSDGSHAHPIPLTARPHYRTVAAPPSFAPGGRRFAYTRERTAGRARGSEIWIAAIDGSEDRRLRAGSAPAWSPDGRTIAYTAAPRRGRTPLRLMDAVTGRRIRQLVRDGASADWSPDGRRLVLAATTLTWPRRRVVVVADPTRPRRVRIVATDAVAPVWSPDGQEITYVSQQAAGERGTRWVVRRGRPRASGPRRVVVSLPSLLADGESAPRPADLAWQPLTRGSCRSRCLGVLAPRGGSAGLGTAMRVG